MLYATKYSNVDRRLAIKYLLKVFLFGYARSTALIFIDGASELRHHELLVNQLDLLE